MGKAEYSRLEHKRALKPPSRICSLSSVGDAIAFSLKKDGDSLKHHLPGAEWLFVTSQKSSHAGTRYYIDIPS